MICEYGHSQCIPSAQSILDVNNVTAPIDNDGSIGWNETPFQPYSIDTGNGSTTAGLAMSLWVGGLDDNNQLHLAAMRYGQVGNDYFPGPLNTINGQIDSATCSEYDQIWKIDRWKIDEFIARWGEPGYVIPWEILYWPAHGNILQNLPYNLAPYYDTDGSGHYNPEQGGDYPFFNPNDGTIGNTSMHLLNGDQALWWVINDNGGAHTETGGLPIGLEIRCIAYAFDECGPLANTTFFRYQLVNAGSQTLHDAFVGIWVDADLGFAEDEFVQCDVERSLGFNYDAFSFSNNSAFGVDLLHGPYKDNDGLDNDNDGIIDNENVPMSRFLYHNSSGQGAQYNQDPSTAADHYSYLQGRWLDGSPMCYGGNGHPNGGCDTSVAAHYMFPGTSDPTGIGTGGTPQLQWTEQTAGNVPYDRRFLMSAGPFTLEPGEINDIHYAAIWANDPSGLDPIQTLELADDYVQAAFDSGFTNLPCCPPTAEIYLSQPSVNQFFFSSIDNAEEYLWTFGDGTTSTERFPASHFYVNDNVYEVTLVVSNDCGSDTASIQVSAQFFRIEETQEQEVLIYPNPATTSLTIESHTPLAQVWVRAGRALRYTTLSRGTQDDRAVVDVSSLPSGIYLVEVLTQNGQRSVQKVVVK